MSDPNPRLDYDATPSKFELFLDFVKSRFLSIVFAFSVGLLVFSIFNFNLTVPRWLHLGALTFAILAPYGWMFGQFVVGLLYDPQYIYLVDLDARYLDGALFALPVSAFREIEVESGELCQLTPHLYTGKGVDLEAMTVDGTWRGTMSDRELLRSLSKVHECRELLEEDAKRGFAIESQAFSIVRKAVRAATLRVVNTFEEGTLPDEGAGLNNAVDDAIERFDLESRIKRISDGEEIDEGDLEEIEPNRFDPDDELTDTMPDEADLVDPEALTEALDDD